MASVIFTFIFRIESNGAILCGIL
jgi:hypothetical protein